MRSPAHLRKACGFCPKPIFPDQKYVKRGDTCYHNDERQQCWTKAKRRNPALAGTAPPPNLRAVKSEPAKPTTTTIDVELLNKFVLREDYDLLMMAYEDQEKRLKRVEAVVDAQVKAIATYISSAPAEPPPQVPEPRSIGAVADEPVTEVPERASRKLTPEQRRRRGDALRGKSRVGGDKPLADVIPSLVAGRPVEGISVANLYTMLLSLGYRVKNPAVVAASCSMLNAQHQIRRMSRGIYGPIA